MKTATRELAAVTFGLLLCAIGGCDGGSDGNGSAPSPVPTSTMPGQQTPTPVPSTVPDFTRASFSHPTQIDNPFFPLVPGTTQLIEDTHDWYAQDDDGNVWYMGEAVDNYNYDDEGNLTEISHEGSWEAGKDVAGLGTVAKPGYQMKAERHTGDSYRQEYYPTSAEDLAVIVRTDAVVEISGETICTDCLQTLEWTPLEPAKLEYKFYAPSVGLVMEEALDSDEVSQLTNQN